MKSVIANENRNTTTAPESTTVIREIDANELKHRLDENTVIIVDVRERDEHMAERIEGSLARPLSTFDVADFPVGGDKTVVLHCRSGKRSSEAAHRLIAAGRNEVCHLKGGIQAWVAAGLPVRRLEKAPISIMRQVQVAAGTMVFAGTILGAFVSSWFLMLSGFVGAGLIFAGLSGTCGMASALSLMPWNRVFRGTASCSI